MHHDCFTDPPTEYGWHNVTIRGVFSMMPIYWLYDESGWHPCGFLMKELEKGDAYWFTNTVRETCPS